NRGHRRRSAPMLPCPPQRKTARPAGHSVRAWSRHSWRFSSGKSVGWRGPETSSRADRTDIPDRPKCQVFSTCLFDSRDLFAYPDGRGGGVSALKLWAAPLAHSGGIPMVMNHLNLTVTDAAETAQFLEKYFGLRYMEGVEPKKTFAMLRDD